MENFSANSAKSYIGKNVNLHLKDGAVIINVQLTSIQKGAGKNSLAEYMPYGKRRTTRMPLRNIAYAELLNSNLYSRRLKRKQIQIKAEIQLNSFKLYALFALRSLLRGN